MSRRKLREKNQRENYGRSFDGRSERKRIREEREGKRGRWGGAKAAVTLADKHAWRNKSKEDDTQTVKEKREGS